MAFTDSTSEATTQSSIHAALGDIVTHGHQLLVNRLDLMQIELRDVAYRAAARGVDVALGTLLAFTGFVLLTVGAVLFLSLYVGQPWACLACGVVYTGAGVTFMLRAKKAHSAEMTTALVPDSHSTPTGARYAD